MSHSDFKAKMNKGHQLDRIDTIDSFDFYTTIVSLDGIKSEQFYEYSRVGACTNIISNLRRDAETEIEEISKDLITSPIRSISLIAKAGLRNFQRIPSLAHSLPFPVLDLPEVWLGDATSKRLFQRDDDVLNELSVDDCFNELYAGEQWVKRFSEGCL